MGQIESRLGKVSEMKQKEEIGKLSKKGRPQYLSNVEKGDYFTSGYNFYKNFI